MEIKNIAVKLVAIQSELKAPKGQYNSFGKYNYRSCEDITEAAKPICAKHGTVLTLDDVIVMIGDRYYVQATAKITDAESGEYMYTTAFAREEDVKKGMDASQLTGATSSYARKYALSGLFALDDTKDSDFTNTGTKDDKPKSAPKAVATRDDPPPLEYKCADCGKPFTAFTTASGKTFSAAQCWQMACDKNIDGIARCKDCREKAGTTKE